MEKLSEEQKTVTGIQPEQSKETYQPLELEVVEVKVEKGYATSESPLAAPQWGNGSW